MRPLMSRNAPITLDATLDRQKKAWLDGACPRIDDILRDSSLPSTPAVLHDLVVDQIEEHGRRGGERRIAQDVIDAGASAIEPGLFLTVERRIQGDRGVSTHQWSHLALAAP